MTSEVLVVVHAAATWFMTGLIWFVHVVHYPLFAAVGDDAFVGYERRHVQRTSWVVGPPMVTELTATLWLVAISPSLLTWIGVALLVVVWGTTWVLAVPRHAELERGFDERAHARLVSSNIVRTLAWTARSLVAAALLFA